MKNKIRFLTLFVAAQAFAAPYQLSDVSILFPLDGKEALENLWTPATAGPMGELLPANARKQLPEMATGVPPEQINDSLRVVGLRIDPCFSNPCRHQIRLVWQPVRTVSNGGRAFTLDAAVHTFYDLTDKNWTAFLAAYDAIRGTSATAPLSVHPRLASEGLKGAFMTKLTDVVLRFIGANNLTQMTFMSLAGQADVWSFGGFDMRGNKFTPLKIPRVESQGQTFVNAAMPRLYFENAQLVPSPEGADKLKAILKNSRHLGQDDEENVVSDVQELLKIEHPRSHNPDTVDCASCHISQAARIYGEGRYPWRMHDFHHSPNRYMNQNHDLRNPSPVKQVTGNLRAFGYFMDQPAINQRAINESAEVADALNGGTRQTRH